MKRTGCLDQCEPNEICHKKAKSSTTPDEKCCGGVDCLSGDMLSDIFSFCNASDLCHRIALVCHKWNESQYPAWQELYKSKFGSNLPVGFSSTDNIDPELNISQEHAFKFFYQVKSQYENNLYVSHSKTYQRSDFPDKESESSWFAKQALSTGLHCSADEEPWPDMDLMLGEEEDESVDDHEFTRMTLVDRLTHFRYYLYEYQMGGNIVGAVFLGKGLDDMVSVIHDSCFYDESTKHQDDRELRKAMEIVSRRNDEPENEAEDEDE